MGPPRRAPPRLAEHAGWVIHAGRDRRDPGCIGGRDADTGGANSPALFLLLLTLVFAAYFFPAREAWPYLGARARSCTPCRSPTTGALHEALLGELLILGPCYWLLAFLLISGKRGMVALRAQADALARQDPLTGLANRRALLEAIERAGGRSGCSCSTSTTSRHQHPLRAPRR